MAEHRPDCSVPVARPRVGLVAAVVVAALLPFGVAEAHPQAAGSAHTDTEGDEHISAIDTVPVGRRIASSPQTAAIPGTYVVVLRERPLATYRGSVPGYPATRPPPGRRFDAERSAVRLYRSYLLDRQRAVLDSIANPATLYSFTAAVNGFAARLTSAQVKQLRTSPDVLVASRSVLRKVESAGAGGSASRWSVPAATLPAETGGAGLVIGFVDTGIWPENPSFAGLPMDRADMTRRVPGFTGSCEQGERWEAGKCNSKIVSAQYFLKDFGAGRLSSAEFRSPRDATGHGSQTASVAAGNSGVAVSIDGQDFGHIGGVAPQARIAVYKACWSAPDPGGDGCRTADLMAALDRALADGVDVLNYSVDGSAETFDDPIQLAFANIADAGVFVATAAGDNGPESGTVGHPAPWVTTVAASSVLGYEGRVELGDGTTLTGAMASNEDVPAARLVAAATSPAAGFERSEAAHCGPGTLDAAEVSGSIVICERGSVPRLTMSHSVRESGGIGMVLLNTRPRTSVFADLHSVPTVQLGVVDARRISRYVRAHPHPTASLARSPNRAAATQPAAVPRMAGFSSRGPARASDDVVKPDLAAPGVNVLGAVAPTADGGRLWDLSSGTSMASPQVAGAAALVKAAHPAWSVPAVKSALMTTATPVGHGNIVLAAGAGELDPSAARDPGLVYDTAPHQWWSMMAAAHVTYGDGTPVSPRRTSPSNVNQPSVAIGTLVGRRSVTRAVTNVADRREVYSIGVSGLRGVDVAANPSVFTIGPGETVRYRLTFAANARATDGTFEAGTVIWNGSLGHQVRTPVAIRPVAVDARPELAADGSHGKLDIAAVSGTNGVTHLRLHGLVGSPATPLVLLPHTLDVVDPTADGTAPVATYVVPPRTGAARFAVSTSRSGDVDLYVYRNGRLLASATSGHPHEVLTLERPRPGRYQVFVTAPRSSNDSLLFASYHGWVVPAHVVGRSADVPAALALVNGKPLDGTLRWHGLGTGEQWFGYLSYGASRTRSYVTITP